MPKVKEADVQRSILKHLQMLGCYVWKNHNIGIRKPNGSYIPVGAGRSDILGLLPSGRFLAIEVKLPGKLPSPMQSAFLRSVNYSGGLAFWADGVELVHEIVNKEMKVAYQVKINLTSDNKCLIVQP